MGAGLFRLFARFDIIGEPAPTAIVFWWHKAAHFPVSIELYRLRLFLDDLILRYC